MSKAIKAIKSMTQAELAELAMLMQAANAQPVVTPVANLAIDGIPSEVESALVDSFVATTDDVSRNDTFRAGVLRFGEAIPAAYKGKALPKADAERMADKASARFLSSYGDLSKATPERKKSIERMVTQKRSRALSLFTCAPILPAAYAQGFSGTIQETLKLCTQLKNSAYDLPKVLQARKAEDEKPKDYGAYIAQVLAGVLNVKADNLNAATARAKAQLVAWCDEYGIKPKHADEYRNPALARS